MRGFFQISFLVCWFQSEPCSFHPLSGLCHWDCLSVFNTALAQPQAKTILNSLKQHLQDRTGMWDLCGIHPPLLVVLVMWSDMLKD